MATNVDAETVAQLREVEAIGDRLAAPIGHDLEPDPSDLLLSGSLGAKLVAALREWRSGPRLAPANVDLLNVMRDHGRESGWSPRETSNAERKLRLLLRRVRQKNPQATNAIVRQKRKRKKAS